jgi:SMI1 / KNR4 family (SUKH-1)
VSSAIELLEARTSITLPADYRAFLLATNGGKPDPGDFFVPCWGGEFSQVHRFFGIHDGPSGNLEEWIVRYRDRLPESFIPIGLDPGGNLLLIGVAHDFTGHVYFWDHEDELDDDGLSRKDMSNTFFLASSIAEFVASLFAE